MPDNQTPELIPRLYYSKNWEDPADFSTHQHSEIQNRRDIQSLFTEISSYINNVMLPRAEQLLTESGANGGDGVSVGSGDYLPLDGGTMRGILRLYREPELNAEAVTKRYADNLAANVNGNLTEIRQTADALELLAQSQGGDIASLQVKADEMSVLVEDVLGDYAETRRTSAAITTRVENANGNFSEISQTAAEIAALVEDTDGNRAEIIQKADEILSLVTDALGNVSEIGQKSDEIASNVSDGDGNASEIRQKSDAIAASVEDAEGNASEIRQKAEEIKTLVESPQGDASEIRQLADEISALVEDAEGNVSQISQTSGEITSIITDAEGNLSEIKQTLDEISTRLETAEGDVSEIAQTIDGITLSVSTVTENGEVYSRLALRIGPNELYGYIKMDGNVNVSGQLSADALYAGYGEIANLAVNTLNTSRRITRYLRGDTSDDNFIRVKEQTLEFVTGSPTGGTAQAKNPDGAPLYWPVDVSGLSLGADGYPVSAQNERIFTVTAPTQYPVQVYVYEEAVKRSISFEPVNGIYSPIDRFGAGNQQGNNKAWILKTADGFDIRYLTPDNQEIGIRMTTDGKVTVDGLEYDADKIRSLLGISGGGAAVSDGTSGANGGGLELTTVNADGTISGLSVDAEGYTDVPGLRKVVSLDFSRIGRASGAGFSETLDGGVYNAYSVQRDAAGRVVKITDAEGHETVITWGA